MTTESQAEYQEDENNKDSQPSLRFAQEQVEQQEEEQQEQQEQQEGDNITEQGSVRICKLLQYHKDDGRPSDHRPRLAPLPTTTKGVIIYMAPSITTLHRRGSKYPNKKNHTMQHNDQTPGIGVIRCLGSMEILTS